MAYSEKAMMYVCIFSGIHYATKHDKLSDSSFGKCQPLCEYLACASACIWASYGLILEALISVPLFETWTRRYTSYSDGDYITCWIQWKNSRNVWHVPQCMSWVQCIGTYIFCCSAGLLDDEAPAVAASDQTRLTYVQSTAYLCIRWTWAWLFSVLVQVCSRCDSPWEIAAFWAGSVESLPGKCVCSARWDRWSTWRPGYCELCVNAAVNTAVNTACRLLCNDVIHLY